MDLHAWRRFRGKLADYIMTMSDGDVLLIEYRRTRSSGDSACVQFFAWGGDLVRCEIPSNEYLHPAFRLDERSRERLLELGWLAPSERPNGSRSYHLDRPRTRCDEIAAHTVTVLRELWGVPHPALLDCTSGGGPQTPPFTVREAVPPAELDFGSAIHPTSRHHLQMVVQRTMAQVLGTAPPVSETG
ncbi:MAG: hypothetical protein ICV72_13435, partial [Aldersonia sp.]|nr:hypothetical protein [Aldersonia sp.]